MKYKVWLTDEKDESDAYVYEGADFLSVIEACESYAEHLSLGTGKDYQGKEFAMTTKDEAGSVQSFNIVIDWSPIYYVCEAETPEEKQAKTDKAIADLERIRAQRKADAENLAATKKSSEAVLPKDIAQEEET